MVKPIQPPCFANEDLERFPAVILAFLFVVLAVIVFMGPKSIVRTISLALAITIAMLATLGGCVSAANFNKHLDAVSSAAKQLEQ